MQTFIDAYCERTGPGLWNEPLNAVTNVTFIVAGVLALRLWRGQRGLTLRNGWDLLLLIALLFAIGIGSALWHTFAASWASRADTIPILLFISGYLLSFLARLAGCGVVGTVGWFALFQLANRGLQGQFPADFLNGSIFYLPTWATLLIMTALLAARRHPAAGSFAVAAGVFTLSLFMRTVDLAQCDAWPIGTHFLWHVFNSIVLYLLLTALIRGAGAGRREPSA
jgi:hypothetical protein